MVICLFMIIKISGTKKPNQKFLSLRSWPVSLMFLLDVGLLPGPVDIGPDVEYSLLHVGQVLSLEAN